MEDFFYDFKNKVILSEQETPIETESDMDKILNGSKKVAQVLCELLTSYDTYNANALEELKNVITDIKVISYKPTTFRVVFKTGNYFDLKYDPTPLELKYKDDFKSKDSFIAIVAGRKYFLVNRSEFEQALDALNAQMRQRPINQSSTAPESGEEPGQEEEPASGEEQKGGEEEEPETK